MINDLVRKGRRFAGDPVLRRWVLGRALGRFPGPPAFVAHRPPYLEDLLPLTPERPALVPGESRPGAPQAPIELTLAGTNVTLSPGRAEDLFETRFDDIETELAAHRFAWLPLLGAGVDPAWVGALWNAWRERFAAVSDGWAWHPYTAAERCVNLLDFAAGHGLPAPAGETAFCLAGHAHAIAERLEYFGEHDTSNHFANNGRGLFRLGLAFGMTRAAELGCRILIGEAERIFAPSGALREGSTHYHLLVARFYADAWLAARAKDHPATPALERVVRRAVAAVPRLVLPGGMPVIGDASPDCPPEFLTALIPGCDAGAGWGGLLSEDDRTAFVALRESCSPASAAALEADGWLRFDFGPWSSLGFFGIEGWPPYPGHGHRDLGGFELHFEGTPVFRDLGLGRYGETADALRPVAAAAHNTLTIDGFDPYPANKPYYDAGFRRLVGGPPPTIERGPDWVALIHHGFARLGGVDAHRRTWHFSKTCFRIVDRVEGSGRHRVTRRLHTTLAVEPGPDGAVIGAGKTAWRLTAGAPVQLKPATHWPAYGRAEPARTLEMSSEVELPWEGTVSIEPLMHFVPAQPTCCR